MDVRYRSWIVKVNFLVTAYVGSAVLCPDAGVLLDNCNQDSDSREEDIY